jgi:hypothetical protein
MADRIIFAALDGVQWLSWRIGIRFQWPCWLLDRAWHRQATPWKKASSA